jgi:probable phosphoglycerate mutase
MKLYCTRHGQTVWNAKNLVCGLTDVELTDLGRAQADTLGKELENKGIDLIICSPLKRARDTAEIINKYCHAEIMVDKRIIELNYGIFEGTDRFSQEFLNNKRNLAYKYPGGESAIQVAHRAYSLIEEVKEKYSDKTVLFVCHNGVCRLINTYFNDLTNDEYYNFGLENCGLMEFEL